MSVDFTKEKMANFSSKTNHAPGPHFRKSKWNQASNLNKTHKSRSKDKEPYSNNNNYIIRRQKSTLLATVGWVLVIIRIGTINFRRSAGIHGRAKRLNHIETHRLGNIILTKTQAGQYADKTDFTSDPKAHPWS